MSTNKEAFENWLDGKTVDARTIQQWQQDEQLAAAHETSLWLKHQGECLEQQPVPQWDREATLGPDRHTRQWFSWLRGSPALSMAMSVAAILMVLFRVEIHFNDNGLLLTFAGDQSQQTDTLIDEKLRAFGRDQQIIMANYVDDIQSQQRNEITQLATYLINASRQERQEDLGELVGFLKDQRKDDISLQQQQFDNMVYHFKSVNDHFKKVSYDPVTTRFRPDPLADKEDK